MPAWRRSRSTLANNISLQMTQLGRSGRTAKVDGEEVDDELGNLHGREVLLPLKSEMMLAEDVHLDITGIPISSVHPQWRSSSSLSGL